jgi:ribonuclease H / adenosylcobalamin/alpha-ribazole phosphatase
MDAFSFYVDAAFAGVRMSLTVLLVRHGTHDEVGQILSGRSDIALNERGRDEAQRLATRLRGASIAAIHTSPRRRAVETAKTIGDIVGTSPRIVAALDEIDFGEWSGQTFDALDGDPRWRQWNAARRTASTPSGDTIAAAVSRVLCHLQACRDMGAILCVSHCDVIRGLVAHCLGLDLDHILSFDIDPGSLTTLVMDGERGRVVALNERSA